MIQTKGIQCTGTKRHWLLKTSWRTQPDIDKPKLSFVHIYVVHYNYCHYCYLLISQNTTVLPHINWHLLQFQWWYSSNMSYFWMSKRSDIPLWLLYPSCCNLGYSNKQTFCTVFYRVTAVATEGVDRFKRKFAYWF